MLKVVAISGWKGSGKDTVANRLIAKFGYQRIGFADPDVSASPLASPISN